MVHASIGSRSKSTAPSSGAMTFAWFCWHAPHASPSSPELIFRVQIAPDCLHASEFASAIFRTPSSLPLLHEKTLTPIRVGLPQSGDAIHLYFHIYARAVFATREGEYMPPQTITCANCGLVVRLDRNDAGSALIYSVSDWQRRCKRPHLDNPAWCLIRRDGTHPPKEK